MDAIDLLRRRIDATRQLVRQLETTPDGEGDDAILTRLLDEVALTSALHEHVLLPLVAGGATVELDHHRAELDDLVGDLRALDPDDPASDDRRRQLAAAVEAQLEREAHTLHPQLEAAMDTTERQALGRQIEDALTDLRVRLRVP